MKTKYNNNKYYYHTGYPVDEMTLKLNKSQLPESSAISDVQVLSSSYTSGCYMLLILRDKMCNDDDRA